MPIQCPVTQPNGAVASYHVVQNTSAYNGSPSSANVLVNSFFDQAAFANGDPPVNVATLDITPLVQNPIVAAPSFFGAIEAYLLMTPTFSGGTQVA